MNNSDISNRFIDYLDSPIGVLRLQADINSLMAVSFVDERHGTINANQITERAIQQLDEYFSGDRQSFDIPISATGTAFQQQVWQQLSMIPYGKTFSYQQIANRLEKPKAVRAVGNANGKNPLTIIVPCHRVIGANGSLTGYAWGLARKEYLLEHEVNTNQARKSSWS